MQHEEDKPAPTVAPCCQPSEEELAALKAGDCRPEELWGGPRPTCPKCIAPTVAAGLPSLEPVAWLDPDRGLDWLVDRMTVPPGSKFVRLDAFTAWLSKAAQGLPEPVELSEDVKEYLREGMENATGGEDDDVDYDFANGLEQLLHPLVRLDACTQVVAGMAARNAELEAEVERSEKHRNDLADTIVSQRTDIGALRAKNAELVGLLRKAWRGPRTDEDCEAIDAALADDTLSPNTPA